MKTRTNRNNTTQSSTRNAAIDQLSENATEINNPTQSNTFKPTVCT